MGRKPGSKNKDVSNVEESKPDIEVVKMLDDKEKKSFEQELKDQEAIQASLNLEKSNDGEILLPYNAIIAIGDFVVVSEEDLV